MQVIGYVKNRYFKIQALKGFMILPGYVFYFSPLKVATLTLQYMLKLQQIGNQEKKMI